MRRNPEAKADLGSSDWIGYAQETFVAEES